MAATAVLVGLHVLVAHGVALPIPGPTYRRPTHRIGGKGHIDEATRKNSMISRADLNEALRQRGIDGEAQIFRVKTMRLEPSGEISIIEQKTE
jgi:hypothetical protein